MAIEMYSPRSRQNRVDAAVRIMGSHDDISPVVGTCRVAVNAWQELDPAPVGHLGCDGPSGRVRTGDASVWRATRGNRRDDRLIVSRLGEGLLSAGVQSGVVRWSGDANASSWSPSAPKSQPVRFR